MGQEWLQTHENTDGVPVPLGGSQVTKLTFRQARGQSLFMCQFAMRDFMSKLLSDIRYCKIAHTQTLAAQFHCLHDDLKVTAAKAKANALVNRVRAGEYDAELGEWLDLFTEPKVKLTQTSASKYYAALLEPIMPGMCLLCLICFCIFALALSLWNRWEKRTRVCMVLCAGKKNVIAKETLTSLYETDFWKENVEKMHFCPPSPKAEEEDDEEEKEKGDIGGGPKLVFNQEEAAKHVYHTCFVDDSTNVKLWTDCSEPNSIFAEYMRMNINYYKMKGL